LFAPFFWNRFCNRLPRHLDRYMMLRAREAILAAQGFKGLSAKIELRLTFRLVHEAAICPTGSEVG
jgi:hypothetical protein